MKNLGLKAASSVLTGVLMVFASGAVAQSLDDAIAAFEAADYQRAEQLFNAQKEDPQALLYLSQIARRDDLDAAEELIEEAVTLDPNNAEIQFQRGITMGAQAGNSIFSALGYAKKSKRSFLKAVELEPESVTYRQGLMGFYLAAPGIAGGDEELALQQVEAIKALDARSGVVAELDYLKATEQAEVFEQTLADALERFADLPDFYFLAGLAAQAQKEYEQAHALFTQGANQEAADERSENARLSALYQIGRTAVYSQSHLAEGVAAMQRYLAENPNNPSLPSRDWGKFRLAQIYMVNGEDDKVTALLEQLRETTDPSLQAELEKLGYTFSKE